MIPSVDHGDDDGGNSGHTGGAGDGVFAVFKVGHELDQGGSVGVAVAVVAETLGFIASFQTGQIFHVEGGGHEDGQSFGMVVGQTDIRALLGNFRSKGK